MAGRVVSVGVLTDYVKQLLETDLLLADLWVEGEVSEQFVSRAGHIYFTMRDYEARLKCVLFKGSAQRQRVLPRIGDQIAAHGRITVYDKTGEYQLYVDVVEHAGAGVLALQFEQLRQKLESEGLFDLDRKRPLPERPKVIGVVTSAEGAVWHDIQNVMSRRYPLALLLLSAAPVQGDAAPAGIVEALERLQEDGRCDVIIVARGGGSAEDLSVFNDERVARAVFACPVPVVSAVGHETDWTIIDYVADLRASTPSAAAELVAPSLQEMREQIGQLRYSGESAMADTIGALRMEAASLGRATERLSPAIAVGRHRDALGTHRHSLTATRLSMIDAPRRDLVEAKLRASAMARAMFAGVRAEFASTNGVLVALDPNRVLQRGYAIIESVDTGVSFARAASIFSGDTIAARMADGRVIATVGSVEPATR